MGSGGRGGRTRKWPRTKGVTERTGFEEHAHNQWTIEGQFERAGQMQWSRMRSAPRAVRWFIGVIVSLCVVTAAFGVAHVLGL